MFYSILKYEIISHNKKQLKLVKYNNPKLLEREKIEVIFIKNKREKKKKEQTLEESIINDIEY